MPKYHSITFQASLISQHWFTSWLHADQSASQYLNHRFRSFTVPYGVITANGSVLILCQAIYWPNIKHVFTWIIENRVMSSVLPKIIATWPIDFIFGIMWSRAAQFSFRPGDYLPLDFGLNFRNPSYIYIRACCIIYICSLYHSMHKFTINNPNLCIINLEIFNQNTDLTIYRVICFGLRRTSPPSPPLCAALMWSIHVFLHVKLWNIATQITKTLGMTLIQYWSDTFKWDRYLIDVNPRAFANWVSDENRRIVMMTAMSSLIALVVVITTSFGTTNDNKVSITPTLSFQYAYLILLHLATVTINTIIFK